MFIDVCWMFEENARVPPNENLDWGGSNLQVQIFLALESIVCSFVGSPVRSFAHSLTCLLSCWLAGLLGWLCSCALVCLCWLLQQNSVVSIGMESERCLRRVWPKDGPVMDSIQIVSRWFIMSTKSYENPSLWNTAPSETMWSTSSWLEPGGSFTARAACPQFLCLGMARTNLDSLWNQIRKFPATQVTQRRPSLSLLRVFFRRRFWSQKGDVNM